MKKVYFAIGYQPVENFIIKQMEGKIDVVGTTVYRESILPAVLEKEPDILITRETLPGSTDFLDIIDRIRVECQKDVQIIFITGGRQPGDAFLSALVRYGVYDLVVGDNIKMQEVCRMIEQPNKYRDVFMYSPKVKIDEKTKKEVFQTPNVPKVIEKEVIKEIIIDNTTVSDANASKVSLEELKKIEEQKLQIEKEQENLLKMKAILEQEKLSLEESKKQMNDEYESRKAEFEEEMLVRLRSIENDRDNLIKAEQEKLRIQMEEGKAEIERLKEEANNALNLELKQLHELKQQEIEAKIKSLEKENERKIRELKEDANHKSMEEQERFNQIRIEEIEKFQQDKIKLERKYATLREEQQRQAKLREEQEQQMQLQMQLLKKEQLKLKAQREKDLHVLEEAKKQLKEEKERLQEESNLRIKEERDNLEKLLKEKELELDIEKNQIKNDYEKLNSEILKKIEIEKNKIQKDANEQFILYKQNLRAQMIKKLEEEKKAILSDTKLDKANLEKQLKEQQQKLQADYQKELDDKMNDLKNQTSEKLKLEQEKIEKYRKDEESKLQAKKNELILEKENFRKQKEEELKLIEVERKKIEIEYKELEENIKNELKAKEIELDNNRKIMEEKQIQLKKEMDEFIRNERERLDAINQETLQKEREQMRLQEEETQREIELEKKRLLEERKAIEEALKEQSILMEKEKQEFNEKMLKDKRELEIIKKQQEELLKVKELEMEEIINSQKEEILQIKEQEEAKIEEKIRLMREEEEKILKREEQLKEQELANKNLLSLTGDKKILTFLGSKSGVGTSTVAFNTAISLANNKKKVLYVELNHVLSTVGFIYKLNFYDSGLDIALKQMHLNNYENLSKNIISLKDVINNTSKDDLMLSSYKKMPKNLEFMFYSGKFYSEERTLEDEHFKELLIQLLTKHDYDYIIFDLNVKDINYQEDSYKLDTIAQTVLQFSSRVYFIISQDVASVGGTLQYRKILTRAKLPFNNFKFILNKYESKSMLDKKGLEDWLETDLSLVIPDKYRECINSNYIGLPLIINSKDKDLTKSFNNITQDILKSNKKTEKKGVIGFGKK